MADYRLKLYLGKDDFIDVTCVNKPDNFQEFLDSFSDCNFAIFNNGPNGYVAIHMSQVIKIEATRIDKRKD